MKQMLALTMMLGIAAPAHAKKLPPKPEKGGFVYSTTADGRCEKIDLKGNHISYEDEFFCNFHQQRNQEGNQEDEGSEGK